MRSGRARALVGNVALGCTLLLCAPAARAQGEPAAMITEIKIAGGRVEVKSAGSGWRAAAPLAALRAGDQVRAAGRATAVVLLTGGRGTVRVAAANSPYTVPAAPGEQGKIQKARSLLAASLGFLSAGTKESPRAVLSTRSATRAPEVLTPRNGPVLPDSIVFEWLGSQFSRYTVRVLDPAGVVVERKGLVGTRFAYPADAPPLRAGVRYRFEVEALGHPPYEAWFEVLDAERAAAVRDDLRQLEDAVGPGVSPSSLAVVRAGALASRGLVHDARLVVLAALARGPDEPALHVVLGNLYLATGLPQMAAESLDEADFLLSQQGK